VATFPRAHAVSDVGLTRSNNQDSGYAGRRLFVVADGMGGHAGGDIASALAVQGLAGLDREFASPGEAETALRDGFLEAADTIADMVAGHPELAGMGTTVSAVALVGDRAVVAHIGDSRVYRLRDGALEQVTSDHTFVQRLVETGRITAEEAAHHPRRSVLMRVLGDIDAVPEVDIAELDTSPGDRWLLCSDGLSSYISENELRRILSNRRTPEDAAEALLREALSAGGPDNITIVVLDVSDSPTEAAEPVIVGSAAQPLQFGPVPTRSHSRLPTLLLHPLRSTAIEDTHFEPETDEYLAALLAEDRKRLLRRRITAIVLSLLAVVVVAASLWLAYRWTQSQYYIGVQDGRVAVFQGVQQDLGPITLHHLVEVTDVPVDALPEYRKQAVQATISVGSLSQADATVKELRDAARR